jgi:hypothetical protein
MLRTMYYVALAAGFVLLGACGHGDDSAPSVTPPPATPTRGQLVSTPTMTGTYSASDLLSMLTSDPLGKELLQLTVSPTCTVNVYHMEYETVGGAGEATTASAALMVPTGSGATCSGARPVVMYAHGTNTSKTFNMANLANNSEGLLMASIFASQGYIVVAPNYAGYDTSTLPYHPYLNGQHERQWKVVRYRIFPGWLCGHGHAQGDAGGWHRRDGCGAHVRALRAGRLRRCDFPR